MDEPALDARAKLKLLDKIEHGDRIDIGERVYATFPLVCFVFSFQLLSKSLCYNHIIDSLTDREAEWYLWHRAGPPKVNNNALLIPRAPQYQQQLTARTQPQGQYTQAQNVHIQSQQQQQQQQQQPQVQYVNHQSYITATPAPC